MTDETDRDDPAWIPGDPDPRYGGYPPMTDEEATALDAEAEDWWRQAPLELQPFLRVLATPMSELGFDDDVIRLVGKNTTLAHLLTDGGSYQLAALFDNMDASRVYFERFEEPFRIGDLGVDLQATMDLAPFLPYLGAGRLITGD